MYTMNFKRVSIPTACFSRFRLLYTHTHNGIADTNILTAGYTNSAAKTRRGIVRTQVQHEAQRSAVGVSGIGRNELWRRGQTTG